MRPGEVPRALQLALGNVPVAAIEADKRVKEARARRNALELERDALMTLVQVEVDRLAAVDAAAMRARAEKARLEAVLPSICSRVLVGDAPPDEEGGILGQIRELDRQVCRHELGRAGVEDRVARARAVHDPVARDVVELDREAEAVFNLVRDELARNALGWS